MIESLLAAKTAEAIKYLYGQEIQPGSVNIERTPKEITGDYTIVIFPLLRISKKSPADTAAEIGEYLKKEIIFISHYQIIKGFLNIFMTDEFWISFVQKEAIDKEFGFTPSKNGPPVLIEFSSPNTNKPLHLGHIRNNLLGSSLAAILKANGEKVVRLCLVNDRGIHICKSMIAYLRWGNNETPESSGMKGDHLIGKYYVIFSQKYKEEIKALVAGGTPEKEAEKIAPLMLEAQELLRKWEDHDPATIELWNKLNNWVYDGFAKTYDRLGISFDKVEYESRNYLHGKSIVLKGMQDGHLISREDGSIWIDLRDEGLDEKLLLRSDGTSVYMTQDLGTAELRHHEFDPSKMIYVVGNEQNYHFDVLKRVLKKLGKEWSDDMYHLSYGMVELPEGKMKSREGTVVDADDLMDEMYNTAEQTTRELGKVDGFSEEEAKELFNRIGLGALKYFILRVDPRKNMLFDPKESIDFNGNTGPFIQYTYARIKSLLRKAATASRWNEEDMTGKAYRDMTSVTLVPQEKEIFRILYRFPDTISEAGTLYSPAIIAGYLYELSKGFNQFYQEIPVLKEENPESVSLRLLLSFVTGEVIRKGMTLLGIEVPERM